MFLAERMESAVFTWLTFGAGSLAGREFLKIIPVMGDNLQQEIGFTHQHVTFANLRPGAHHIFEFLKVGLGLACQPDKGEHIHRMTLSDRRGVPDDTAFPRA